jgi:hypothetical protein
MPVEALVWTLTDRFKIEDSLSKTAVHQAAVSNNSPHQTKSRHLNKQDRDQQLCTLVKNFTNLTLAKYMESLLPFFDYGSIDDD